MKDVRFWLQVAATTLAIIWLLIPFVTAAIDGFCGKVLISRQRD